EGQASPGERSCKNPFSRPASGGNGKSVECEFIPASCGRKKNPSNWVEREGPNVAASHGSSLPEKQYDRERSLPPTPVSRFHRAGPVGRRMNRTTYSSSAVMATQKGAAWHLTDET